MLDTIAPPAPRIARTPWRLNGDMVQALLAGTKHQIRHPVQYIPALGRPEEWAPRALEDPATFTRFAGDVRARCPHGQVGQTHWVQEGHAIVPTSAYRCSDGVQQTINPADPEYAAVYRVGFDRSPGGIRWRGASQMPRWAARLFVTVTAIRLERLQDISAEDAVAEGLTIRADDRRGRAEVHGLRSWPLHWYRISPIDAFERVWAERGIVVPERQWDANPWVWVLDFTTEARHAVEDR